MDLNISPAEGNQSLLCVVEKEEKVGMAENTETVKQESNDEVREERWRAGKEEGKADERDEMETVKQELDGEVREEREGAGMEEVKVDEGEEMEVDREEEEEEGKEDLGGEKEGKVNGLSDVWEVNGGSSSRRGSMRKSSQLAREKLKDLCEREEEEKRRRRRRSPKRKWKRVKSEDNGASADMEEGKEVKVGSFKKTLSSGNSKKKIEKLSEGEDEKKPRRGRKKKRKVVKSDDNSGETVEREKNGKERGQKITRRRKPLIDGAEEENVSDIEALVLFLSTF